MHRGLIIRKNPGHSVPEDCLQLAVKEFPSGFGAAIVTKDKELLVNKAFMKPEDTLNSLKELQEGFKSSGAVFFFAKFPENALEDDLQPFIMIGDSEKPEAVAFLEGEFTTFDKGNSSHSSEYHCAELALGPLLAKAYTKLADQDLDKFDTELDDSVTKTSMRGYFANRGVVSILTANDKLHTEAAGELRKNFDWGWMSQHMGYGETASAPAKTEKKLPSFFGKDKKAVASTVPITPNKEAIPAAPAVPANGKPKTDTAVPDRTQDQIEKDSEYMYGAPPVELRKNHGQGKGWYRTHSFTGQCPNDPVGNGWPRVQLKVTKKLFADWAQNNPKRLKGLEHLASDLGVKILEQKEKEQSSPPPQEKPGTEALPTLKPEETQKLIDWAGKGPEAWKKAAYGDNYDPVKIQAREEALPSFEDITKIKLEETFGWDHGIRMQLGERVGVSALSILCGEYQKTIKSLLEGKPATEKKVEAEPLKATGTEGPPAKKLPSFFGKKS